MRCLFILDISSFNYYSYYILGDDVNLKIVDDKYIYFTSDTDKLGDLSCIDENNISIFLRDVFLNISNVYLIDLFGYYKVDIYIDDKIGAYVEIFKLDDYISYSKKIDTKVSLVCDNFYFKTNDLSQIFKYRPIYYLDDYYYVSTKDVDNIFELMDFCEIEYKNLGLNNNIIV